MNTNIPLSERMTCENIERPDRVAHDVHGLAAADVCLPTARAVRVTEAPHQSLAQPFRHDNAVVAVDLDQEVLVTHGPNGQVPVVRPLQTHVRVCGAPDGDAIALLLVPRAVPHPVHQDLEHLCESQFPWHPCSYIRGQTCLVQLCLLSLQTHAPPPTVSSVVQSRKTSFLHLTKIAR
jgi:hypothetical protein